MQAQMAQMAMQHQMQMQQVREAHIFSCTV
jgi:hypothetical protein